MHGSVVRRMSSRHIHALVPDLRVRAIVVESPCVRAVIACLWIAACIPVDLEGGSWVDGYKLRACECALRAADADLYCAGVVDDCCGSLRVVDVGAASFDVYTGVDVSAGRSIATRGGGVRVDDARERQAGACFHGMGRGG